MANEPVENAQLRLAKLLRVLNREAPYTMKELHAALVRIKNENPSESEVFNVGCDIEVHLFRLGWIKRTGGAYFARIPDDGRTLSVPPPPRSA